MRPRPFASALPLLLVLGSAPPSGADLFFSEYVEGTGFNKAIEIYNPTNDQVDLGNYAIERYSNGEAVPVTLDLEGTLAPGDVVVIANPSASSLPSVDVFDAFISFNGNDALALVRNGSVVDVFGQIGFNPGNEWVGTGGFVSTQDDTLRRKFEIATGDPDGTDVFDPAVEWNGFGFDVFSDLGVHFSVPEPDASALALGAIAALCAVRRLRVARALEPDAMSA